MAKRRGMIRRCGVSLRGDPIRLGRRRAHAELDRALDHGERLPLAVDDTSGGRRGPSSSLISSAIRFRELRLLVPLPQGPFGRAVDAGVGVVFVEVEQLGDQRVDARRGTSRPLRRCPGRGSSARRIEVSGWKRMASIALANVGRGSPDPALPGTEGLPESAAPPEAEDLRSGPGAGSGDPRPTLSLGAGSGDPRPTPSVDPRRSRRSSSPARTFGSAPSGLSQLTMKLRSRGSAL